MHPLMLSDLAFERHEQLLREAERPRIMSPRRVGSRRWWPRAAPPGRYASAAEVRSPHHACA